MLDLDVVIVSNRNEGPLLISVPGRAAAPLLNILVISR